MFGFVRRRAKPGVPSEFVLRSAVWEKTGGYCYLCGADLHGQEWHVDHMWSVARNGPDLLANMMPACARCNEAKGAECVLPVEGTLYRARKATHQLASWLWQAAGCGRGEYILPAEPILGPHVATLRILPPPGYFSKMLGMHHEIRAALHSPDAAVRLVGRELWVSVPRKVWRDVRLQDTAAGHGWMDLGLTELNDPMRWAWASIPHLLVCGVTGSGKSETVRTIVAQSIRIGAQLVLVDADGDTFVPFSRSASLLCQVAGDLEAASRSIRYAHAIMEERPIDPHQQPAIVLAVDELHVLGADDLAVLLDLAARSRRRNMHLVLATHRPTARTISPDLKNNCTGRVALASGDALASRLVLDMNGAERLRGRGDCLMIGEARGQGIVRGRIAVGSEALYLRLPVGGPVPTAPDIGMPEAVGGQHGRKDIEAMVGLLVDRYEQDGLVPSVPPLEAEFGGNKARLMRARDEACRRLGLPTPAEKRASFPPRSLRGVTHKEAGNREGSLPEPGELRLELVR